MDEEEKWKARAARVGIATCAAGMALLAAAVGAFFGVGFGFLAAGLAACVGGGTLTALAAR